MSHKLSWNQMQPVFQLLVMLVFLLQFWKNKILKNSICWTGVSFFLICLPVCWLNLPLCCTISIVGFTVEMQNLLDAPCRFFVLHKKLCLLKENLLSLEPVFQCYYLNSSCMDLNVVNLIIHCSTAKFELELWLRRQLPWLPGYQLLFLRRWLFACC